MRRGARLIVAEEADAREALQRAAGQVTVRVGQREPDCVTGVRVQDEPRHSMLDAKPRLLARR